LIPSQVEMADAPGLSDEKARTASRE